MDFCHLQEIYATNTGKKLLGTATETGLDATNLFPKKQSIKHQKQQKN